MSTSLVFVLHVLTSGQLVHVDLYGLGSHVEPLGGNLLRLASHDELLVVLVLDDNDAGV
jgi:hypothetical protein